jgi:hypothetical protein
MERQPVMRKLLIALPVLVLAGFIAVGAYLIFGQSKSASQPASFHFSATTPDYNLVLAVAPPQKMYTPAQVNAQHPTDGEVMFSGTMIMPSSSGSSMSNMDMSNNAIDLPGWRHVEVHIYTRSNQVVKDVNPIITIRDDTSGKQTDLPIVTMQGIVAGPSDFHYGNNAYLPSGRDYSLTVRVNNDDASFDLKL